MPFSDPIVRRQYARDRAVRLTAARRIAGTCLRCGRMRDSQFLHCCLCRLSHANRENRRYWNLRAAAGAEPKCSPMASLQTGKSGCVSGA